MFNPEVSWIWAFVVAWEVSFPVDGTTLCTNLESFVVRTKVCDKEIFVSEFLDIAVAEFFGCL